MRTHGYLNDTERTYERKRVRSIQVLFEISINGWIFKILYCKNSVKLFLGLKSTNRSIDSKRSSERLHALSLTHLKTSARGSALLESNLFLFKITIHDHHLSAFHETSYGTSFRRCHLFSFLALFGTIFKIKPSKILIISIE